jgi:hypothetical protein
LSVEGYWNHDVRRQRLAPGNLGQPPGEPPAQGLHALEFEQHNRPH